MGDKVPLDTSPQNGEIDWAAVFDGLASTTHLTERFQAANNVHPPLTFQGQVQDGTVADQTGGESTTNATIWDHLFPSPLPPSGRLDLSELPQGNDLGSSQTRPRLGHRTTYPYSAPMTPIGGVSNGYAMSDDMFASLVGGLYHDHNPKNGETSASASASARIGNVPLPRDGLSGAQAELEERLRRLRRDDDQIPAPWSQNPQNPSPRTTPFLSQTQSTSRRHQPNRSQSIHNFHHSIPSLNPGPNPSTSRRNTLFNPLGSQGSSGENTPNEVTVSIPDTPGMVLDTEDKRQRNTVASAKFRAKRKKHIENIGKRIEELESEQTTLTRDVSNLKQENKFLREMVELKYGLDVGYGQTLPSDEWQEPSQQHLLQSDGDTASSQPSLIYDQSIILDHNAQRGDSSPQLSPRSLRRHLDQHHDTQHQPHHSFR